MKGQNSNLKFLIYSPQNMKWEQQQTNDFRDLPKDVIYT
jgi:hypothetical protein